MEDRKTEYILKGKKAEEEANILINEFEARKNTSRQARIMLAKLKAHEEATKVI